jgi:hypothetical protein
LNFKKDFLGSKRWFFLLARDIRNEELNNIATALAEYVNDENYPLEPIITEKGILYNFESYGSTIIYESYTVMGKLLYFIGFIFLAGLALFSTFRLVRKLFNTLGQDHRTTLKREISVFAIFLLFGFIPFASKVLFDYGIIPLASRAFFAEGFSFSMDINIDMITVMIISLYPVYLAIAILVFCIKKAILYFRRKGKA